MTILRVALNVPLPHYFDYLDNGSGVQVGQRVLVPFGSSRQIGVVLARAKDSMLPQDKLKSVLHAYTDEAPLPAVTLRLLRFCADYYHNPFGQVLFTALPPRLRKASPARLPQGVGYRLTALGRQAGLEALPQRARVLRALYAALAQAEMLDIAALAAINRGFRAVLRQLLHRGWVESVELTAARPTIKAQPEAALLLSTEQRLVLDSLPSHGKAFGVWLLHGITGSGKTEIYLQWLATMLAEPNTQVLVLVPEINLTPQLEARFRVRFPQHVIVMLHSQMNESERLHGWLRAQNGEARIIIGTRLAVFTPMRQLAAILVDEEHDASYKQQDGMRYSARDVAIARGRLEGVPVLLGSATPSLESWHNANIGRYYLLSLHRRAVSHATLPAIRCLDMRLEPAPGGLAAPMLEAIEARLKRGEQSLLFINRRGFAPVLLCSACGWVAPCLRCSARLVVHLREKRLRCHHCGHEERIPLQCPSCGNPDLHPIGHGTQRLEEVLAQHFPQARLLRVDRDSMRRRHAVRDMAQQVQANAIDILVGTQMLVKGHDFPNLTLVGVVETDSALFSPDFRAAEHLFAQLMQVAGRAGRADKAGEVLIQTQFPDHPLFHALKRQDYPEFATTLLEERRLAHFPPYCFEALLRAEATRYESVHEFLELALQCARNIPAKVTVYEPVRPRMERLHGMERAQLLVQSDSRTVLQGFLRAWVAALRELPQSGKVRWSVDVDPLEY